jgi:hypothetical protein
MEVYFSPNVETRLRQPAFASGKDAGQLVKDTVARMLENQARSSGYRKLGETGKRRQTGPEYGGLHCPRLATTALPAYSHRRMSLK